MSGADTSREPIKIGTSGYSYPGSPPKGWFGVFYPKVRGERLDELEFYSRFFNTVEINTSFYRPPSPSMARAWAGKASGGFEFSVKAWQKFTHARKIGEDVKREEMWEAPAQQDVGLFRQSIGPLAESGKLGVLLFQYPPGFHFSKENAERLIWTVRAFRDYPKAVELRHRSWSDRDRRTKGLLAEFGANWVLIDEPKFGSSIRQEFEPVGDIFYLRLHGRNRQKWWQHEEAWERYDYLYSPDEIGGLAQELKSMVDQRGERLRRAFVFFNNHAKGQAVVNAIMLSHEMGIPIKARPIAEMLETYPQVTGMVPDAAQRTLL